MATATTTCRAGSATLAPKVAQACRPPPAERGLSPQIWAGLRRPRPAAGASALCGRCRPFFLQELRIGGSSELDESLSRRAWGMPALVHFYPSGAA